MKTSTIIKQIVAVILFTCLFCFTARADIGYAEFKSTNSGLNALETTIGATTMTIEMWLYIDNNAGFFASNMHNDKGFLLGFDGWFKFQIDGASVWIDPTSWKGNWTHIACVADGTKIHVYVNGESAGSSDCTGYNTEADNKPLYLGRAPWGAPFTGKLADFRLWNIARSADDISANYQQGIDPATAGLIKNFNFMEGTGDNTSDLVNPEGNKGWFMGDIDTDYAWGIVAITPTDLQYAIKGQNALELSWNGTDGNKWTVEITDPEGSVSYREDMEGKTADFSDLSPGKYTFRVKESSFIETAYSEPLEVTIPLSTSLNEKNLLSSVSLSQDKDWITLSGIQCVSKVSVYNANGQLIFNKLVSDESIGISLSNWDKGLYLFNLDNSEGKRTWKIIK